MPDQNRASSIAASPFKWPLICVSVMLVFGLGMLAIRAYARTFSHVEKQSAALMDTVITIYARGPAAVTGPAVKDALKKFQDVYQKFNPNNPESPVYNFNHNNVPITDPDILYVVDRAMAVSDITQGAFDITTFPLTELWHFNTPSPREPSAADIRAKMNHIGYQTLALTPGELRKDHPAVRIDLGGIAKGFAVAEAVKILQARKITSALIDAGGDIYALGLNGKSPWQVGIENPDGGPDLGYVSVSDLAVMGSGNYRRFFKSGGKRYHHIFNPHNGYPSQGLKSVTVIYPDPTLADAFATALFVLGADQGIALANSVPGLEALLVTDTGSIELTEGLENNRIFSAQANH